MDNSYNKILSVSWEFSETYGITSYDSGWRKYVASQRLECEWPHERCLCKIDSLSTALPKYSQRICASVGETICSWHERQQETDTVKKSDSSHYKAPVKPLNVSGSAQKMSLTVLPRQQSW